MTKAARHDESKAWRGPDGRYLPGHKPPRSPGRPPGPNGVKARAAHLASERLEQMIGKAADVISDALDAGDTHVATWMIDRVRPPKQSDFLKIVIDSDLNTPEHVVGAAREAAMAAGRGEISMSDAKSYIDLLARYGGMQGYLELEQLKVQLDELNAQRPATTRAFDQSKVPAEYRLKWGNGTNV
jgi:hypothetical protein